MRSTTGFTLLELLVAVALLAVIGVLGTRALGTLLEGDARVRAQVRQWNDVSLALTQMERDVSLAIAAPVGSQEGPIVITRLGDGDADRAQSGIRRVGYRLRGTTLEYLVWQNDSSPTPNTYPALDDVGRVQWQALNDAGAWTPIGSTLTKAMPRAFRMEMVLTNGERITRIFAVR